MKKNILIIAILVLATGAGYVTRLQFEEAEPVVEMNGELANDIIDFALPDLEGTERRLSDWSGESRIVNFWATWCAPCRREIPLLKALQADKAANRIQVIGVAVDYPEEVALYAEQAEFNYPVLVGQEEAMAAAEASGIEFIGLPFTLVLAPDGELVAAHMGEIKQEHVEEIVEIMQRFENGAIGLEGAREALHLL
jgi:thiol-disulfide isomerase/thioredoxin